MFLIATLYNMISMLKGQIISIKKVYNGIMNVYWLYDWTSSFINQLNIS